MDVGEFNDGVNKAVEDWIETVKSAQQIFGRRIEELNEAAEGMSDELKGLILAAAVKRMEAALAEET